QEELEQELQVLNNSENIKRALLTGYNLLSEQDAAVLPVLREAVQQLQSIEKFNTEYESLNERLRSSLIELKDIAGELAAQEENMVFDPGRIEEIGLRLD